MVDMECPCKNCSTREFYAKKFDIHIWGDDCPYECERYNAYCADEQKYQNLLAELKEALRNDE